MSYYELLVFILFTGHCARMNTGFIFTGEVFEEITEEKIAEDCQARCVATRKCTGWTWKRKTRSCQLFAIVTEIYNQTRSGRICRGERICKSFLAVI